MRKILVLRGGALGDFIVTLPALTLLRRRWPAARIELVGNAVAAELARNRGLLDAVHSQHEGRWAALFAAGELAPALSQWLADFDLVLNYWPDPDDALRRRFPRRAGQTFLTSPALPTQSPAARHYCEPLRAFGLEAREDWTPLSPLADQPAVARTGRTIAIHPGSGSRRKNWPAERWRELINGLADPVLLILGEAEIETWGDARLTPNVAVAAGLNLETLVTQLAGCARFTGHDSGISHLAAACGVPSLLLFGPTDPAMWAPPAPQVSVLRKGQELTAISVAEVRAALLTS